MQEQIAIIVVCEDDKPTLNLLCEHLALFYRDVLSSGQRAALAFYSATELLLVVAITTLAVEAGHMEPSTAAGLVGAAMLSVLCFPFVGMALLDRAADPVPT